MVDSAGLAVLPGLGATIAVLLLFLRLQTRWSGLLTLVLALSILSTMLGEPAGGLLRMGGAAALLMTLIEMNRWPSGSWTRVQQARGALEEAPAHSPSGAGEAALAQSYTTLTNRFLATARPVLGARTIERIASSWLAQVGLEPSLEVRRGGLLYLRPGSALPSAPQLLRAFFALNLRVAGLLRVFRAPEETREMFAAIFGTTPGSYGEMLYAHGAPLLLVRATVDPLLEAIPDREESRRRLAAVDPSLAIGPDGRVVLASFYEHLSRMEPAERSRRAIETLSGAIRALYPLACEAIGVERSAALLNRGVSHLLRDHGPLLSAYRLEEILPRGVVLPGLFRIRPGASYLLRDPRRARQMFGELVRLGLPGLSISRGTEPAPPGAEVRWLGRRSPDGSPAVERMAEVLKLVDEFCGQREGSVVLLDGLEYLSTRHDFTTVLRFVQDLKEVVAARRARLLLPVDPEALGPRDMALLARDLEGLEEG